MKTIKWMLSLDVGDTRLVTSKPDRYACPWVFLSRNILANEQPHYPNEWSVRSVSALRICWGIYYRFCCGGRSPQQNLHFPSRRCRCRDDNSDHQTLVLTSQITPLASIIGSEGVTVYCIVTLADTFYAQWQYSIHRKIYDLTSCHCEVIVWFDDPNSNSTRSHIIVNGRAIAFFMQPNNPGTHHCTINTKRATL